MPDQLGELATTYVEAFHLVGELADKVSAAVIAAADEQRSESSTLAQGADRSVAGTELSRAEAAHLYVGGDPGLWSPAGGGASTRGFCSVSELSPGAQRALEVFRQAAPDPAVILAIPPGPSSSGADGGAPPPGISLNDVLVGSISTGSLRDRLGAQPQYPQFNNAICAASSSTTPCVSSADGLASVFGIHVDDFGAAREYLAQEIQTFSRSLTAVLNPTSTCTADDAAFRCEGACSGSPGTCDTRVALRRYAATANPPKPIDDVYWATLAQHYSTMDGHGGLLFGSQPFPANLAQFEQDAIISANDILSLSASDPYQGVRGTLGFLLNDVKNRVSSALVLCNGGVLVNTGGAYSAADQLRIVSGEDGLRCATEGNIEGAPCDLDAPETALTLGKLNDSLVLTTPASGPLPERAYLVRPKHPGTSGAEAPGAFEALVGFSPNTPGCGSYPIDPDAIKKAAAVLKPSRQWCTQSETECDNSHFDDRLPLENSLDSDSDPTESSWKTYLNLAQQAAAASDQVGKEYIDASLQSDQRAEQVSVEQHEQQSAAMSDLSQLQDICGTDIDVLPLLQAMTGPGGDLKNFLQSTDNFDSFLQLATANTASGQRIATCLGTGEAEPLVTLGSDNLCVAKNPDTGALCPGGPSGDCPRDVHDADATACTGGEVWADHLGYFVAPSIPNNPDTASLCRDIREARTHQVADPGMLAAASPTMKRITGSTFFNPENLKVLARRIGYEARFGGYSAITVDGQPKFETGDFWKTQCLDHGPGYEPGCAAGEPPANLPWPCGPYTSAAHGAGGPCPNPPDDSTLFCSGDTGVSKCDSRASRGAINDRMLRAVVALRAMALGDDPDGLKNVFLPMYFYQDNQDGPHATGWKSLPQKTVVRGYPVNGTFPVNVVSVDAKTFIGGGVSGGCGLRMEPAVKHHPVSANASTFAT